MVKVAKMGDAAAAEANPARRVAASLARRHGAAAVQASHVGA
jgi:hypothetical protein